MGNTWIQNQWFEYINESDVKMLNDYFNYTTDVDDDGYLIVTVDKDGTQAVYRYIFTMNSDISDDKCCKVLIDGEYYYFG